LEEGKSGVAAKVNVGMKTWMNEWMKNLLPFVCLGITYLQGRKDKTNGSLFEKTLSLESKNIVAQKIG